VNALKRLLPRGLLGRSLLIMVTPVVLLQIVALQVFYGTHWEVVSRRMTAAVAAEIAITADLMLREQDAQARAWVAALAAQRFEFRVSYSAAAEVAPPARLPPDPTGVASEFARALAERVPWPVTVDWQTPADGAVAVQVALPEGALLVEVPHKRLITATVYVFVAWVIGSAVVLVLVATLFMRNQVKPLRRLAGAAEAFGKGVETSPIKPEGAIEVRQAANAFNRMRERIERFVESRTEMLAGVSHDLRTPLTRLQLGLAMLPRRDAQADREIAELTGDLREMERMVEGYLAFARGEGAERAVRADLAALVEEVAERARRDGASVEVASDGPILMSLRVDAMRRAIGNLVENARKHATRVRLGAIGGTKAAFVTVDDDGPGIPVDRREAAFRPFVQLDPSRGRGGVGLGLTIARDIVRAHGGDLALEDSPLGGLRARIRLPA